MPKATFTQEQVRRAVKAVQSLDLPIARVEVAPSGRIVVVTTEDTDSPSKNDWDDE